jgi:protein-tyrosine phosphatase
MKVLFACLGNICRSPIAEGVLRELSKSSSAEWVAASCAIYPYHIGEPPHKHSIKVCKQHGYDISAQRARLFSEKDFEHFDRIYVMAKDVYTHIADRASNAEHKLKVIYFSTLLIPNQERDITDPWYGDEQGYLPVFQEIEAGVKALMSIN